MSLYFTERTLNKLGMRIQDYSELSESYHVWELTEYCGTHTEGEGGNT